MTPTSTAAKAAYARKRKRTPEETAALVAALAVVYRRTRSLAATAAETGWSTSAVQRFLDEGGVERQAPGRRAISPAARAERAERAARVYARTGSVRATAKEVGISYGHVSRLLTEVGVPKHRPGRRPRQVAVPEPVEAR